MQNYNNYPYSNFMPTRNEYAFVDGVEAAKAYQMPYNSMMLLLDNNNPILYRKQTDAYGRVVSFEIYDLVAHQDKPPVEYVTKDELNRQIADLKALMNKEV